MKEEDIIKLFTQQLLEENPHKETQTIEEGIFDRMRVRAKTLKANVKNKMARLGGKLNLRDKESVERADMIYIDAIGEELDKIYKPRFQKLFKKYFKDSAVLTGSIIDDHGVDKKKANQVWEFMSSPEVMESVYTSIKETLMLEVLKQSNKAGLDLKSI